MQSFIRLLLASATVFTIQAHGHLVPNVTSYRKEQTFMNKRIILGASQVVVTDSESFLYAICDSQEKTFKQNKCNVTVETPAFDNATYKETCHVNIAPTNPKLGESLTKLRLYPFEDDKAILSWLIKDHELNAKSAVLRILHMSDCKYTDVTVPAGDIYTVLTYDNTFDVVMNSKSFCGSDSCRVTYNLDGKKLTGPVQFLPGVKFSQIIALDSVAQNLPTKGFFVLARTGNGSLDSFTALQTGPDGKQGKELLVTKGFNSVRSSNAHEYYSVCWTTHRTNVTCKQFDAKSSPRATVVLEFLDEAGYGTVRWLQPHNLQEGGLVLATGQASGKNQQRFESFSVIRINPDGKRARPLEIEGLDFECSSLSRLLVNIADNELGEICFHFACESGELSQHGAKSVLRFSTRCLPKQYIVPVKHKAIVN